MKSRVHPKYKTKYHVGNWPEYERSRLHHSEGQGDRAPPVEEGGGLPPAGPRGKRLLPVQVDHWRPASCSTSEGPGNRSSDRVQHPEPDDRAWSTGLVCNRAAKVAGSGRFSLLSGSCTNAGLLRDRAAVSPRDHRRDPSAAVRHVDGADGPQCDGPGRWLLATRPLSDARPRPALHAGFWRDPGGRGCPADPSPAEESQSQRVCRAVRPLYEREMSQSRRPPLVVRMAVENPQWGYTRIRGALSNLGHEIARTTVKRTRHDHGIDPAPERSRRMPWKTFLQAPWEGRTGGLVVSI